VIGLAEELEALAGPTQQQVSVGTARRQWP
jgi:hypothetical protein